MDLCVRPAALNAALKILNDEWLKENWEDLKIYCSLLGNISPAKSDEEIANTGPLKTKAIFGEYPPTPTNNPPPSQLC